jgi:hypothetical protein
MTSVPLGWLVASRHTTGKRTRHAQDKNILETSILLLEPKTSALLLLSGRKKGISYTVYIKKIHAICTVKHLNPVRLSHVSEF